MKANLAAALKDRYAIDREIGAGGMATVYLARDIKHNRNVALKVLSPELGAVLGVDRFLAEIQVTANLQHPHLLPLFDSGEAAGLLFYVMPYVQGESLRARLQRERQLPVDEAIRIATGVASALDYAHRHNIVHRDLKPENILLQDGQPVVADFGIALAVSNAGGTRVTQTGLSLGTPQYMSPEQATGDRTVDGRSDIYSLASLTYEMLAGEAPHLGNTVQAIMAKVLTEKPVNVRVRRPSVPAHVAAALDKALEKTPADRFSTAHEFADALVGKSAMTPATDVVAARPPRRSTIPRARELMAWGVAIVSVGALVFMRRAPAITQAPVVVRSVFDLPAGVRVNDALTGATIAVSPKGDMVAFTSVSAAGFRLFVRRTNEIAAREIGSVAGRNLAFSPDGRWLAYSEGNLLRKISVDGGQPVPVSNAGGSVPYGLTWSNPDTILVGTYSGLYTVPAAGGTPKIVSGKQRSTEQIGQRWPQMIPGTDNVVYVSGSTSGVDQRLAVTSLHSAEVHVFDIPAVAPLGVLNDNIVYASASGTLSAVSFDPRTMRIRGDPVPLEQGVVVDVTAGVKAALSPSGTLFYLSGRSEFELQMVGAPAGPGVPVTTELHQYQTPRLSPDGRKVAVVVAGGTALDIFVYNMAQRTFTRLTTEGSNLRPEWTPDGKHIVFRSERNGKIAIWWQPEDGSGPAELLYQPAVEPYEALISPDGKWLVYRTAPGAVNSRDILAVPFSGKPVASSETPRLLVGSEFAETMPRLSPDGNWLAYQSNENNRFEIFVRPFPGAGARVQVSSSGGTEPLWGRNGRSLYYRDGDGNVVRVDVTTGANFSIGDRHIVTTGDYLVDSSHPSYDVAPDGRLLMIKRAGADAQTIVVHNWGREMREKTRGKP